MTKRILYSLKENKDFLKNLRDSFFFLEDFTEEMLKNSSYISLFNDNLLFFRVRNQHDMVFKLASDWNGNWLAGNWYHKNVIIKNPHYFLKNIHLEYKPIVLLNIDLLEQISSWSLYEKRYIFDEKGT